MLYIKKLIICDEYDEIILKIERKKAIPGLTKAIKLVQQKDGNKGVKTIWDKFKDLDQEFKEYFDMEGKTK